MGNDWPTLVCEECGEEYQVRPDRVDDSLYCSPECLHEGRKQRIEATCQRCGDTFEARESRENPTYCSKECQRASQREEWSEDGNPRWDGGPVTVECEVCGDAYEVVPARVEETRFCSYECRIEVLRKNWRSDGNPRWGGGLVTVECEQCGDEYEVVPARVEVTRFCSRLCYHDYLATQTGQENPNWQGGVNLYRALRSQFGDRAWDAIRKREIDDECLLCGSEMDLELHHIIPLKAGGTHGAWNLMTLCVRCHGIVEHYTRQHVTLHLVPSTYR